MSTDTTNPAAPSTPPAKPVPVNLTPSGWKALKLYEREIATYRRELPRLLEEGYAGQYALIKEDEVLSIWETQGDAIQAGRERFGLEPICINKIDPRDPELYAALDAYLETHKDPSSPSYQNRATE